MGNGLLPIDCYHCVGPLAAMWNSHSAQAQRRTTLCRMVTWQCRSPPISGARWSVGVGDPLHPAFVPGANLRAYMREGVCSRGHTAMESKDDKILSRKGWQPHVCDRRINRGPCHTPPLEICLRIDNIMMVRPSAVYTYLGVRLVATNSQSYGENLETITLLTLEQVKLQEE